MMGHSEKALQALRLTANNGRLLRSKNGWICPGSSDELIGGLTVNTLLRKGLLEVLLTGEDGRPSAVRVSSAGTRLLASIAVRKAGAR